MQPEILSRLSDRRTTNEVVAMDIYRQIEELRCELNAIADLDELQEIQHQLKELQAKLEEQEREP
jgi:hypothetical protein